MGRHKQGTGHGPDTDAKNDTGSGAAGSGGTWRLRPARLPAGGATAFDVVPDAETRTAMQARLGLSALRKLRLAGTLTPVGSGDWLLQATLGATVVQPCTVTLDPVTTRIDEPVTRRYLARFPTPTEAETEMPEDDTAEPLPEIVDLRALAEEALALALPAFPRAEGVAPLDIAAAPPGAAPLSEATRPSPFAALARMKDRRGN